MIEMHPKCPSSHGREDESPQIQVHDFEPVGDPEPQIQVAADTIAAAVFVPVGANSLHELFRVRVGWP